MNTQPLSGPIELLKASWAFYTSHWTALTAILAVPYALTAIGSALSSPAAGQAAPGFGILGVLLSLVGAILGVAATVGFIKAADSMRADPVAQASLGQTYKAGFKLFWAFILVSIIRALMSFGSFVLLVIPAIAMGIYAMFAIAALIVDDKHGMSAFTESFALVRGRWWGIFGRTVFLGLCCLVIALVILGAFFFVQMVTGPVPWLLNFVMLALMVPFALVYYYELYRSAKATRLPEADTSAFKNWLVAFMTIGVLALIALPVIGIGIIRSSLSDARSAAAAAAQQASAEQSAPQPTPANGNLVK